MSITHPKIGNLEFMTMRGEVTPMADAIKDITPGYSDEHQSLVIGKRGEPCQLVTLHDATTAANAATHRNACVAYQGTLQTVRNANGLSLSYVEIINVRCQRIKHVYRATGGVNSGNYLVTMVWTVRQAKES